MDNISELRRKCHINTNNKDDRFVGIKGDSEGVNVYFPLGYQLPLDDLELKRDILHLFRVLDEFTSMSNDVLNDSHGESISIKFPLNAYLEIINQFVESGIFTEKSSTYKSSTYGHIKWNKTIQSKVALIQKDLTPVYTDYIIRKSNINENNEITSIHKHCIYESFEKLGWLFTEYMPEKPNIKLDTRRSISILRDYIRNINNDRDKRLFKSMIDMLLYMDDATEDKSIYFGTYYFEYVWEKLIDKVFGIYNKKDYFPRTNWILKGKESKEKAPLEPDSIMLNNGNVYILDAKYYKYGVTGKSKDLPNSSSINKQITYGEYIHNMYKNEFSNIFNAFLMPYNSLDNTFDINTSFGNIGVATGEWKENLNNHEKVQGILIDTRYLMYNYVGSTKNSIEGLSRAIEDALINNNKLLFD